MMDATHKCTSTDGGGTEHNEGLWSIVRSPKTITFLRDVDDEDWFDRWLFKVKAERIEDKGDVRYAGYGNVIIDHEDGTFTAYPSQCGTPYYFEPIAEK